MGGVGIEGVGLGSGSGGGSVGSEVGVSDGVVSEVDSVGVGGSDEEGGSVTADELEGDGGSVVGSVGGGVVTGGGFGIIWKLMRIVEFASTLKYVMLE